MSIGPLYDAGAAAMQEQLAPRIAALEADLAVERERSAGLAAVITREHGPQYVSEFDCAAILARVRAEAMTDGQLAAMKELLRDGISASDDGEIRRRVAALEAALKGGA